MAKKIRRSTPVILWGVAITLLFLFIFWAVGYFMNGLYGYKFQLDSCWAGLTAVGSAGVLSLLKWLIDSIYNSDKGSMPEVSAYVKQEDKE